LFCCKTKQRSLSEVSLAGIRKGSRSESVLQYRFSASRLCESNASLGWRPSDCRIARLAKDS
jgi:hypothetical protein